MNLPMEPDNWLQLLFDDAPVGRFEECRRRLLDESPHARHPAIEQDAKRALGIRAHLDERKRQADELSVLNDLARRLTSMRDSADVLQEVTVQAQRLLAVDVAYIMLAQEGHTLLIEFSTGTIGAVLLGIALEPGEGLGGQVFASGTPMWSRDYLQDKRFPHTHRADDAAAHEQLGGILGVPLLLNNEPIGVLLAAERNERDFERREVALLAALAAHSAVAISNARLFEANRATLDDLRRVNDSLEHDNLVRRKVSELREEMTTTIVRGGGIREIGSDLTRAIGGPLSIYDAEHRCVFGTHPEELTELLGSHEALDIANGTDPTAVLRFTDRSGGAVLVAPARLRNGYAGCLVVKHNSAQDHDLMRLLPVGSAILSLVVSSEHTLAEVELRSRSEFLHALLSVDVDESSIGRRAAALGFPLEGISSVLVFDCGTEDPARTRRTATRVATDLDGWAADYRGRTVVMSAGVNADQAHAALRRLSGDGLEASVGIAECHGGVGAIRESYEMARQTATVLQALGRTRHSAQAAEVGVYRSLLSKSGRGEVLQFIRQTIGPLIDYDNGRQRDLGTTLRVYLEQAQNHAAACRVLHIHANTLYQRLERITELLGRDWRDPDRTLETQLALKLHKLAATLNEETD